MKNIFLFLILIIPLLSYSQKGQLIIKIDNKNNVPNVEMEFSAGKILLKHTDAGLTETFRKFNIYKFEQVLPSSRRTELLKYYIIQAEEYKELMQELKNKHTDKFSHIREYQEPKSLHTPNDYDFTWTTGQDGLRDIGLSYLDLINAPDVWEITKGDPNIIIGIHDNHLYIEHEDLSGKIYNVYDANIRTSFFPLNQRDHGTMVAGIASAKTNNDTGISSIAYNCRLAKTSSNHNDLLLMAQDGIKVINISQKWADDNELDEGLMDELTEDYGVTVVAAAGNENSEDYIYPASYDNVISVTSVGHEFDRGTIFNNKKFNWKDVHKKYIDPDLTSYTHTHNDKVDICAPGYNILTFCHPETYTDGFGNPTGQLYHIIDGTSFAAPLVAGVSALMYSINPGITPLEVKNIIKSTAVDIYSIQENSAYIGKLGAGRIDAHEAVKEAGTTYLTGLQNTRSISAGYGFKLNDITINDNADVILTARKEVVINGTFEMPVGSTFEISIDPNAVTDGG